METARVFATTRASKEHGTYFDLIRIDGIANEAPDAIRDITPAQLEWAAHRLSLNGDGAMVLHELKTLAIETTVEKWDEVKQGIWR